MSVNDSFLAGFSHIPNIADNLIKSQFFLTNAIGDISNFYTNNRLDISGALLSAVFLQQPENGSIYPTLNPQRQAPLKLYLYTGSKFGYMDSGSLACLAKSKLTGLYQKHFPECIHKLKHADLLQVKADLINSYVDDLITGTTVVELANESKQSTFLHNLEPPYDSLTIRRQAEHITISKALKISSVLDFNGFAIKKFNSSSGYVQNFLTKIRD